MRSALSPTTFAAILLFSSSVHATTIVDESPDTLGLPYNASWANQSSLTNFLMAFSLASATPLNGMDIYSASGLINSINWLGVGVTIKLTSDGGGLPNIGSLQTFTSVVSVVDQDGASNSEMQRLHADFAEITLSPGNYWIGMSGTGTDIGWSSLGSYTTFPSQWQLAGNSLDFSPGVGKFAFRIVDAALEQNPTGTWSAPLSVPGPIVGAGLPGLLMAVAGLIVGVSRRPRYGLMKAPGIVPCHSPNAGCTDREYLRQLVSSARALPASLVMTRQ